jgi:glutathione S-transferase
MADLVLYTNPLSRGRIARWMLEEVGRPYAIEVVDYADTKSSDYLAINPMGKLPTLTHGETVVTEVAAICAYLADAFPEAGLAPAVGDPARGAYYRWLFFAAGPLEYASSNRALGFVVPSERERMMGYGTYERVLDTLEQLLSDCEYVAGDRFSAADLYLGAHLGYGMQFKTIEARPAFEAYWKRVGARPAFVRAMQLDDEIAPRPMPPAAE